MSNLFSGGALSGIIAGIVMGLISMLLHAQKICKLCIIAIGGGIFSGQLLGDYNIYGLILSWLIHLALSAAFGILTATILSYTGPKHYFLKGAGIMTLVYLFDIGLIAPLRGILSDNQQFPDLLLVLFYHIFFGCLAAYLIVRSKVLNSAIHH